MADFSYTGSGGIELFCCAKPTSLVYFAYPEFQVGDFVWLKHRARVGKLEKVNIKKINLLTYLQYNYQDTFNRIWLEHELCDEATAEQLIDIYRRRARAALVLALKNCN